jgi:hypothetical protein
MTEWHTTILKITLGARVSSILPGRVMYVQLIGFLPVIDLGVVLVDEPWFIKS